MATITVNVDEELKEWMERHPEINWSEVTRQAIREKINQLERLDELTADSQLRTEDVGSSPTRSARAHEGAWSKNWSRRAV
jgi:Arc/MetJ-type ribon-helix-helix transcriptional regulator